MTAIEAFSSTGGDQSVSVVLGSLNRRLFIEATIDSVRSELRHRPHEIIVVDGGSSDGTLEWLVAQKDVITILQHNRGTWRGDAVRRRSWGYFMNLGFRAASGKYVCMLSDDCLVVPGAIRNGVVEFEQLLNAGRNVGSMAFYWRNWPEQERYWVGRTLGLNMFVNHGLYLKSALDAVGYIDEETYRFYHADGDLCLKLWEAGYECVDGKSSFIEHYSHANLEVRASNLSGQGEDWERYISKWRGRSGIDVEMIGDWLYLDHVDQHHTARRFAELKEIDERARRAFVPLIGRIRSRMRARMRAQGTP